MSPWSYGIVRDSPLLHVAPHHTALECSSSGWKGFHARYIFIFLSWSADCSDITTIITAKISCDIMLEIWDRKWHMFNFDLVLHPSIRNQTIQYLWKHHFPKSRIVITIIQTLEGSLILQKLSNWFYPTKWIPIFQLFMPYPWNLIQRKFDFRNK